MSSAFSKCFKIIGRILQKIEYIARYYNIACTSVSTLMQHNEKRFFSLHTFKFFYPVRLEEFGDFNFIILMKSSESSFMMQYGK